jgi:type I restriction enzyme S subunit
MRLGTLGNPVRQRWLADQGYRLDASPYLSGAYEARKLLESLTVHKDQLHVLTAGHDGGIYNGPKFRRVYVSDPQYGVPFLGSTDIMEADFSWLPLLRANDARSPKLSYLRVEPGMTLISCSGTVGRMCYARDDMAGFWSSQDVLKVVADQQRILPGYLYAFLYSRYGLPMITGQASGTMVRHLEPDHITELPVPRFVADLERRIHALIEEAAVLRTAFQAGVAKATRDLFTSAGLGSLLDLQWHAQRRDLGFTGSSVNSTTLRALNFSPRALSLLNALGSVPHRTLGEICSAGQLSRGGRFKRIDSNSQHGVLLLGQRQGFWLRPEGRWVALTASERLSARAEDESILIASQGTLGENEVFCRAIFVTGSWQQRFIFSEHFLRVVSSDPEIPGAYLFAFLRSHVVFRILRTMSTGGKQQDIHPELCRQLPVPECTAADRERIAEIVRRAYRDRDEGDAKEDEALALLDEAVKKAAR